MTLSYKQATPIPVNDPTKTIPHEPSLRETQYSMLPTTPTARATTKTLRYSLNQARVVDAATVAITIVLAIATPPPAFLFPPVSCISSVLVDGAAPFPSNPLLQLPARSLMLPPPPESCWPSSSVFSEIRGIPGGKGRVRISANKPT